MELSRARAWEVQFRGESGYREVPPAGPRAQFECHSEAGAFYRCREGYGWITFLLFIK